MIKYLKVQGIVPSYFDFYEECKKSGVPCVTYQKIGKHFHFIIDNSTMPIDVKSKEKELSILLTSYLINLLEVVHLKKGKDYSYIEFVISSQPEKFAEMILDDYVNLFELT